jgi:hypothetical protein
MKLFWICIISAFAFQDPVPYKAKEEFQLKLDMQFKKRPGPDMNKVDMEKRTLPTAGMNAPYLYIDLQVLKPVAEEFRVRVVKNDREILMSRKFDPSAIIRLDLGFIDDIKDQVNPNQYMITFLSKDKDPLSRIEIFFDKDGTYIVNGEKRGKI